MARASLGLSRTHPHWRGVWLGGWVSGWVGGCRSVMAMVPHCFAPSQRISLDWSFFVVGKSLYEESNCECTCYLQIAFISQKQKQ